MISGGVFLNNSTRCCVSSSRFVVELIFSKVSAISENRIGLILVFSDKSQTFDDSDVKVCLNFHCNGLSVVFDD